MDKKDFLVPIFHSKYQKILTPELKGSELAWQVGNKALFTAPMSGKKHNVVIDSSPMSHDDASGWVYEVIFEDGNRAAVLADALEPVFSEKEKAEVEELWGSMWILDRDKDGLYFLDHSAKGSLKDLTPDDLELLASMFDDEVEDLVD